ncbi:MAG: L-seryl-tRNA(Sec) selenium transferase [Deltaproteobacteria bacterium]|nr:L-seryl-tRNA(Sec) selenium transferase [Deltaproteobacteria bacterium]
MHHPPSDEAGKARHHLLRQLPAIDQLLVAARADHRLADAPPALVTRVARQTVADLRAAITAGRPVDPTELGLEAILAQMNAAIKEALRYRLRRTVNATGIVVHTNLGRSLLAEAVMDNLRHVASRYSNLEYDLTSGRRGLRYTAVHDILCEITGAEAAMVVNNNAAAVLLSLETLAAGREVIVSRGELVEIGGSFRIPDVMAKSGAILKEVGTTNRTHPRDYLNAIGPHTALLLKVHTSNYAMVGFTAEVPLAEMVALGREHGIPVMNDLGSGNFVDLSAFGLPGEPTVQQTVATGVDLVTFSGDKLLGGPQAGIILGRADTIAKIRQNPINRALRIDKLTLAALEATLRLYRDPEQAVAQIPTLRMLTASTAQLDARAHALAARIEAAAVPGLKVTVLDAASKAGGGALPLLNLATRCVGLRSEAMSVDALERHLRAFDPPIIGRIENDTLLLDVRTLADDELPLIASALADLTERQDR